MSEDCNTAVSLSNQSITADGKADSISIHDALPETLQHVIRKDLVMVNSKINNMDPRKLKHKFKWFSQEIDDDVDSCRKLLKFRLAKLIQSNAAYLYRNEDVLPYYVVIDFEATCDISNPSNFKHEIIEFPAVLVNSSTFKIEDTFREICRPTVNSQLSEFCQQLTGISQKDVDEADTFPKVFRRFEAWLRSHKLESSKNFCIVTDGPWDVCRFLYVQCLISNVPFPRWATKWLDVRKTFGRFYQDKRLPLAGMLQTLGLTFEGRQHCGLDDATNIARVLIHLMCDGAALSPNEVLTSASKNSFKSSLGMDIITQLSELSIEGSRAHINNKEKFLTYRDIKRERSMKIHALMKIVNEEKDQLSKCKENQELEDFIPMTMIRKKSHSKPKGKKKRK